MTNGPVFMNAGSFTMTSPAAADHLPVVADDTIPFPRRSSPLRIRQNQS